MFLLRQQLLSLNVKKSIGFNFLREGIKIGCVMPNIWLSFMLTIGIINFHHIICLEVLRRYVRKIVVLAKFRFLWLAL